MSYVLCVCLVIIIGASLSEPHMYEYYSERVCIYKVSCKNIHKCRDGAASH